MRPLESPHCIYEMWSSFPRKMRTRSGFSRFLFHIVIGCLSLSLSLNAWLGLWILNQMKFSPMGPHTKDGQGLFINPQRPWRVNSKKSHPPTQKYGTSIGENLPLNEYNTFWYWKMFSYELYCKCSLTRWGPFGSPLIITPPLIILSSHDLASGLILHLLDFHSALNWL